MKWLALLAACLAIGTLLGGGRALAQTPTVPSAPAMPTVAAGAGSLTVSWNAPSDDGGATISAYDIRHIETDASEDVDTNWTVIEDVGTGNSLSHTITGLRDNISYDVQVRAINSAGEGAWSATTAETTSDHGGSRSSATPLTSSTPTLRVAGRIDSATDLDFFSIELSDDAELIVYTTGPLDTVGEVLDSIGSSKGSNNDADFPDNPWNFAIVASLGAGTHYVSVAGNDAATGPYELHVEVQLDDVGNSLPSAANVQPGVVTGGRIGRPGDTTSHDADYYGIELNTATDFYVVAFSETFVTGKLLDSAGRTIATSYEYFLEDEFFEHQTFGGLSNALGFMLRGTGGAGTYYIKVTGTQTYFTGLYLMQIGEAPNPGNSLSTATPIPAGAGVPGRISSSSDTDYFSVSFDEDTHASVITTTVIDQEASLDISVYDDQGTALDFFTLGHGTWDGYARDYLSGVAFGRFEAGETYSIRVQGRGSSTGGYFIFVVPDEAYTNFYRKCANLTTDDAIDPLYGCQWHLNNTGQFADGAMQDINVAEVWEGGNTGTGVNIAIVDDGLFVEHEDLKENVDTSRNFNYWSTRGIGTQRGVYSTFFVSHGTAVAGSISAEHNEIGVRGVAPGAKIYSYNYIDFQSQFGRDLLAEADAMTRHRAATHVSSNSWGPPDSGAPHAAAATWMSAITTGLREGDGGRGLSYIWAGGNGGDPSGANDNSNLDGFANFYGVTAVCAVDHNDAKSVDSEPGANLWVCAPSSGLGQPGITTTAEGVRLRFGGDGSDYRPGLYRDDFGGTSAATPIVSGVVALVRSANSSLTWRDVKLILAASARQNDAGDSDWETGALQYGSDTDSYSFNHKYGFGVVDAGAAVALADGWTNVPSQRTHEVIWDGPDVPIDALNTTYTRTVTVPDSGVDFIEFVEVHVDIDHPSIRDLKIELESPSGATSLLVHSGVVRDLFDETVTYRHSGAFRFGSAKHLGESPAGQWKLHVTDEQSGNDGTLREFRLKFYGHGIRPESPSTPAGTSDSDSLTLTWSAPGDTGSSAITSYDLRYIRSDATDKADDNWTVVTSAWTSGSLSYDLTALTLGVRYDIQVRAVSASGSGPWSEAFVDSVAVLPGAPTNLLATVRNRGLLMTWDPPTTDGGAEIQRYDLRRIRSDATDDNWTEWTGAWRSGDGDRRALITGLTNETEYDVQVRAANRAGEGSWSGTASGTPEAVNLAPSFPDTETGTRSVGEHQGSDEIGERFRASDPEDDPLTYSLGPSNSQYFSIDASTGQLRGRVQLNYESRTQYRITVRVSDLKDANDEPDTQIDDSIGVVVNVLDQNDPPSISGPLGTRTVAENSTGTVARYVGSDPDGDSLSFILSGIDRSHFAFGDDGVEDNGLEAPGELRFKSPPDFENPADANEDNTYEFWASTSDGVLSSRLTSVVVRVTNVEEPPTLSGPTDVEFPEDSTGVVATYQGADPEQAYEVDFDVEGSDVDFFEIDDSGQLTFRTRPNYEDVADENEDNVYELVVVAYDALRPTRLDALVRLTDIDEAPEVVAGRAHVIIEENSTDFVDTYTTADPEGQIATWETPSGADAADFDFDRTTGELSLVNVPDFEVPADANRDNVYDITLRTSDGTYTGTFGVKVTITPVDEPPVITGLQDIDFDENASGTLGSYSASDPEGGTVILAVSGADAGDFTFTSGVLAFKDEPNFEDQATYSVTIEAADSMHTATLPVTVNVRNLDEAGTLTLPEQPQVGTEFSATLSDPDGGISGDVWTWERSLNGSSWTEISGATSERYAPDNDDFNHFLRVTVQYTDGQGPDKSKQETSVKRVRAAPVTNHAPEFASTTMGRSVDENSTAGTVVGNPVAASDPDPDDTLTYGLSGPDALSFSIDSASGQIRVGADTALDHEGTSSYTVTVTATDPSMESDSTEVTIAVNDVNEPPVATDDRATTNEDSATTIDVLRNDDDPEGDALTVALRRSPQSGTADLEPDGAITYTPNPDAHGVDSFTYAASAGPHTVTATVFVTVNPLNDAPQFAPQTTERTVSETARQGDPVGAPFTATDVDDRVLTYSLSGSSFFAIAPHSGQINVAEGAVLDATNAASHSVTVTATDESGASGSLDVTIAVTVTPFQQGTSSLPGTFGGGGGGGGGPSGPTPSDIEFEWNVTRDIEELDGSHDVPAGAWSDGTTLWLLENGAGADDAIYAYDLETGERVEAQEYALDERNRAPRGIWSDGTTVWVSDSGQDELFVHDFASGERLPDADIPLAERNRDPRGIWSDGETMYVLDGGKDSLFAYDLAGGTLLAEYTLDSANDDPHGIWSDGVSVWVSNHDPKRLFAYRLPSIPEEQAEDAEPIALERVRDEEFDELSRVSNNSPRGLWSDGDVMYVADESDGKVYSYNMPDAIDARLASLELSGVDFGEFSSSQPDYEGVAADGVTETTVVAEAVQSGASVVIEPADSDEDADGHQVALDGLEEITVTVTSSDGTRMKVYSVRFGDTAEEEQSVVACLRGAVNVGFSLLVSGGGSVDDLEACAEGRSVTALYVPHEGEYVPYILGAPDFVNEKFGTLYPDGLPALTPLIAKSEGPPSPAPASDDVPEFGPDCLRGAIAEGFSLVLYEGGSAEDLDDCAASSDVSTVYALIEGEYTPYILGAPGFVNEAFVALFPDGLSPVTPLIAKRD